MDVLVMVSNRLQQVGHVLVMKAVVRVSPNATDSDQPPLPKEAQLVGSRARFQFRRRSELLHRALARQHRIQQSQATCGPESAHRIREFRRLFEAEGAFGLSVLGRVRHHAKLPEYLFRRRRNHVGSALSERWSGRSSHGPAPEEVETGPSDDVV